MTSDKVFHEKYRFGSNPSGEGLNRFYFGDNLTALKDLCNDKNVQGKVKLIYIDPPYSTGQEFIGYNYENAYTDKFETDEMFLSFLEARLVLLRELLAVDGSFYLHIDTKIGHYVKVLLDKIFGKECFRNEITRIKCNPKNFYRKAYGNIKDVIFFYSKTKPNGNDPMVWNDYRRPLSDAEINKQFPKIDEDGRRYTTTPLHAKGETLNGPTGQKWKGILPPKGRHWRCSPEELTRLDEAGLIEWSPTGNPRKKIYADENLGKKLQDVWEFKDKGFENAGYPTEKNQEMLDQIVLQSSNKGDLVLDCFAGSGSTLLAAEKSGRKWIGVDDSRVALLATLNKLLNNRPDAEFQVYYGNNSDGSDLDISMEHELIRDEAGTLFDPAGESLMIRFVEIRNNNKYRANDIGLVLHGRKSGETYFVQRSEGQSDRRDCKVPVKGKDEYLIIFDIHGNERVLSVPIVGSSSGKKTAFSKSIGKSKCLSVAR